MLESNNFADLILIQQSPLCKLRKPITFSQQLAIAEHKKLSLRPDIVVYKQWIAGRRSNSTQYELGPQQKPTTKVYCLSGNNCLAVCVHSQLPDQEVWPRLCVICRTIKRCCTSHTDSPLLSAFDGPTSDYVFKTIFGK